MEKLSKTIEYLGGAEAVANLCGVTKDAVYKWMSRKSIPYKHAVKLLDNLSDGKTTLTDLMGK